MNPTIFQIRSFLNYWLDAVDGHSLHSPFFYNFYANILKKKFDHSAFTPFKEVRQKFKRDSNIVEANDLGVGPKKQKKSSRQIASIAFTSSSPEKYSLLYADIIRHFKYKHILELGTSLGINALYLSKACASSNIATFEGSPDIAAVAKRLFDSYDITNVKIIEGNIDQTLPEYLSSIPEIDFAFMDANHRYEPTLRYFEFLLKKVHANSIIILDDIYYSREMGEAWKVIQNHASVYATMDLYRCGLVFFNPSLNKQNVVLEF